MKKILVIGIGAGDPEYVTMQAVKALNAVDVFFLLDKGEAKTKLLDLRREICERYIVDRNYRFAEAVTPERVRGDVDYRASVGDLNDDKQRVFEQLIGEQMQDGECGAFLVWGDPSLYDSTIRILNAILASGRLDFEYDVIPGITSVQALTARHKIPLNRIGKPVAITTGRRLATGFPADTDSVAVMLDAENTYRQFAEQDIDIYWGAYLGTPDEILIEGPLREVAARIERVRGEARAEHGWIMDTYLLRRGDDRGE
jgi:precorrin-6A synthase